MQESLSSLVEDVPITVEGEEFDISSLPPIRPPPLRSMQVPVKLPSVAKKRAFLSQLPSRSKPLSGLPQSKEKTPLSPLYSSSPRKENLSILPSSTRRKNLSILPSSEKRVIRVIRAAPRGLFNIPQIPDYSILNELEQEALRVKFNLKLEQLQKANPNLPPFGREEPLHIIHVKYDQYVRQAYVEKTVIKYKIFLSIFFLVIEALGTRVLGIPISGYTSDQLSQFIFYEQLLLELAERSKTGGGDEWPVEIRIFLYMIYQVVIFLIIRFVSSFLSPEVVKDLRGQINDLMVGTKPPPPGNDGLLEPPRGNSFDPTNLMASLGSLFTGTSKPKDKPVDISRHKLPFEE